MLMPNKTISLKESILFKSVKILSKIDKDVNVIDLYKLVKKHFEDLLEFIDALDLLFVLEKINYDENQGVIKIVKIN